MSIINDSKIDEPDKKKKFYVNVIIERKTDRKMSDIYQCKSIIDYWLNIKKCIINLSKMLAKDIIILRYQVNLFH